MSAAYSVYYYSVSAHAWRLVVGAQGVQYGLAVQAATETAQSLHTQCVVNDGNGDQVYQVGTLPEVYP